MWQPPPSMRWSGRMSTTKRLALLAAGYVTGEIIHVDGGARHR